MRCSQAGAFLKMSIQWGGGGASLFPKSLTTLLGLAGANGSPYKHFCRNRKELLGLDRFQPRRAQGHCSNFQVYTIV